MKKTGLTGAIPQPVEWSFDPARGVKTTRKWEGTGIAELNALELDLRAGGWAYSVSQKISTESDALWTVTATRGGEKDSPVIGGQEQTEVLSDTWELASNIVEKDILESDSKLMADFWDASAVLVDPATEEFNSQQKVFDYWLKLLKEVAENAESHQLSDFDLLTPAKTLAQLIVSGVKYTRVFQPTLRHNKIVTSKYTVQDALTNCGSIITASAIKGLEDIPETVLFNLPTDYDTARGDAIGVILKYGWFKKYPNVSQRGDGEWEISQEFEWGLWPLGAYDFV